MSGVLWFLRARLGESPPVQCTHYVYTQWRKKNEGAWDWRRRRCRDRAPASQDPLEKPKSKSQWYCHNLAFLQYNPDRAGFWCWWCRWPSPSSCPDAKLLLALFSLLLSFLELFLRQDNSFWQLSKSMQGKRSNPIWFTASYNCSMCNLSILQQCILLKKLWNF